MSINLSLIADWEQVILKRIESLRKGGFRFPDFTFWRTRVLASYKLQRKEIVKAGADTSRIDLAMTETNLRRTFDRQLLSMIVELDYRVSRPYPRNVRYAASFKCPSQYMEGLEFIKARITKGESLFPHVSREVFDPSKHDGLLLHWGIYHFHLGIGPDKTNSLLVARTDMLLYAMMQPRTAYFITVDRHGRWMDLDLLRIVKKNFPEVLEVYKIPNAIDFGKPISDTERRNLRRSNVNSFIEVDGDHYISPGGGVSLSGASMRTNETLSRTMNFLEHSQKILVNYAESARTEIEKNTECSLEDLHPHMESILPDRIAVKDEQHHFLAEVVFDAEWESVVQVSFSKT